jgi:hypothetical protein
VYHTAADREVFDRYLARMAGKDSLPFDSLLIETATFFLGTPYAGATLEKEPEGLVVNLRELDCFTFVENVLALSRMLAAGDSTFGQFCRQLRQLRYRDGMISGYAARLHYTSDWLHANDSVRALKYLGKVSGGQPYTFDLRFMSSHPGSYRQLKADSSLIPRIREAEQRVNRRTAYYYLIPPSAIDSLSSFMRGGDIVSFVTSIEGLDISHVGFITRKGKKLTFIHASSLAKKVIINKESLKAYVLKGKSCRGIMLARPLPPAMPYVLPRLLPPPLPRPEIIRPPLIISH